MKSPKLCYVFLALSVVACDSAPGSDDNQDNGDSANGENPGDGGSADGENQDGAEIPGALVLSEQSRESSPEVAASTFAQLTADNRDFAFSLLEQLRRDEGDDENLFVSPHSISVALAMVYAGAENNTRTEMADVLRFRLDDEALHAAFNRLDLELGTRADVEVDEGEAFDLDIVNQTWAQEGFDFVESYLDALAAHYGAAMRLVDFVAEAEAIRLEINEWVEARTGGRIEDLLPALSLDDSTRFVLVNAIYFYGSWGRPFEKESTSDQAFTRLDGSTVEVPMMRQSSAFPSASHEASGTVAVALPYIGDAVSMIALMPAAEEADFLAWESEFDREAFDAVIEGLSPTGFLLSLPRFETNGEFGLKETFEAMGMDDAFDACDADFEGITGHPPCSASSSLYISQIYHQTFVRVDEDGTEAAGATAVVLNTPPSATSFPEIAFDRPFLYAIYDHPTETILFVGRMIDPS